MSKKTDEFLEIYDDLCEMYGDPLEVLFDIANDPLMTESVRVTAAKECVNYRHPKRKAVEVITRTEPIGVNIDKDDANL